MKVALISIARWEETWICEWIEHYKKIGIDKIFLGDNNDFDYIPSLYSIIKQYIDEGFVDIINYQNKERIQCLHYRTMYNLHKNEYDWFCCFDCDEYLSCDNIKDFLSQSKFDKYNAIAIPWIIYDDNNLLELDNNKKLQTQLTSISKYMKQGTKCKTICRNNIINGDPSIHIVHGDDVNYCFSNGVQYNIDTYYKVEYDGKNKNTNEIHFYDILNIVHLKHYIFKTVSDYVKKVNRGRPCVDDGHNFYKKTYKEKLIYTFFRFNVKTKEKEKYLQNNL